MEICKLCSTCSKKCKVHLRLKPVSFYCPNYKEKKSKKEEDAD